MTDISGAEDKGGFDSNTLLLECEDKEYLYISGFEIVKFKIDDKIIDFISLMGNNMCRYGIMVGKIYTYFIAHHCTFIEIDKIEEGALSNPTDNSLDPFDYHVEKCGVDSFRKLEYSRIHLVGLLMKKKMRMEGMKI